MIINDLSHLEDIPDSKLILGAGSGLVISDAFSLGPSGYALTRSNLIKQGSVVRSLGISIAGGGRTASASTKASSRT